MKAPLVVDIETVGSALDGRVVSLAWKVVGEDVTHVIATGHLTRQDPYPEDLLAMMADPERPFVSFTKYDARFLRLTGVEVTGPFYDVQVMCWVDNENQSLSLDGTSRRYLHKQMDKRIKVRNKAVLFECDDGKLVPVDEAPLDQLYRYNVEDTTTECELFEMMWERLLYTEWLDYYLREEVPFTETLLDMECRGIPLDLERIIEFTVDMEEEHAYIAAMLYADSGLPPGFNLNSNDQLAAYLFSKVFELTDSLEWGVEACECLKSCLAGEHDDCEENVPVWSLEEEYAFRVPVLHVKDLIPPGFTVASVGRTQVHGRWTFEGRGLKPGEKTDSGKWSVSRPALKVNYYTARDPWVQMLLEYKSVDKLLTTYLRTFPDKMHDGRIYGRFNQTGTKTGRLSSSEPNLQNIPSHGALGPRTRDLFRP
jgi:DNA polymerase I-like protein with 3'-5' exonuclease and polymerase domains